MKRFCENEKVNWITYVENFVKRNKDIPNDYFGRWIKALANEEKYKQTRPLAKQAMETETEEEELQTCEEHFTEHEHAIDGESTRVEKTAQTEEEDLSKGEESEKDESEKDDENVTEPPPMVVVVNKRRPGRPSLQKQKDGKKTEPKNSKEK